MIGKETERAALARFEALLDAYGAAPGRWPADRRAWAEALLARSRDAEALRAEAARLDALIDAAAPDPAPGHLVGRVLASAPQPRETRRGWMAGLAKPALGLAFAAVLGLALGGIISPFGPSSGDIAEADSVSLEIAEVDL